MKILAVDTALGSCSAAVLDGDRVLAHFLERMERGHAEAIAPMVQAAMREAGLAFGDLERLAVTTGPGTFTGQRVGIAFMRGLRVALNRPLTGITTLEVMAAAAMAESGAAFAAVLHDAKRDEVYVGLHGHDLALLEPLLLSLADAVESIREAMSQSSGVLAFAGTAARVGYGLYARPDVSLLADSIVSPDALWVARLAQARKECLEPPRPVYLRPPDARPNTLS